MLKVGLALGAGSARGLAHIGVLQVFLEQKIPFDFIVGSSMGALVGAAYAAGADVYMLGRMAAAFDFSLLWDVRLARLGFIKGDRIETFVKLITKNKRFEDLDVPLAVVATDIEKGERVIIREGKVSDAVRASISIPGVFVPVKQEGRLLVDGAVTERLPVRAARELGAQKVIAVDVTFAEGKPVMVSNTLDVIMQSIEILERQIFEELTRSEADVLLQPKVAHISSRDFAKAEECIRLGRECAEEKANFIKEVIAG